METVKKFVYRLVRGLVKLCYPAIRVEGLENLPEGGCILAGNHCQMNGPIASELYFPGDRAIWCAGEMMELKKVPAYAYQDFWSGKPVAVRWFYKLLSYIIAPLSVCIFNNAHTIPVWRGRDVLKTFRLTARALEENTRVIIFPEHDVPHNHILRDFQQGFVDCGRQYHKRTGKSLPFVPIYLAQALKTMYIGEPIYFDPANPIAQERERVCNYLMEEITRMAESLPRHKVVPYNNISRKHYGYNREDPYENTCG